MTTGPITPRAKQRYDKLKSDRNQAESRAKQCADLTIPSLYKQVIAGTRGSTPARSTPYQSTGARCVNSLSSRLLLALFPPNTSFFKLSPDGTDAATLAAQANIEEGELEAGLAEIERTVINDIETTGMRAKLSKAIKLLVATGNALLYIPDEGNAKTYPISRYVVHRDGMGTVMEVVTLDSVSPGTLDEKMRATLAVGEYDPQQETLDDLSLYTHIYRDGDLWQVYQEVNDIIVPGSEGTYPLDACPWIPLRIPEEDAEDYGAGLVYEYLGDFDALEKLSKALLKGAASAAKVLWALDENAAIRPKTITQAESGDVLRMKAAHLQAINQDKYSDFAFVNNFMDKVSTRLEMAFGVRTSIQRNGERVTAEEIRYLAQELEGTLGGIYSILAEDLLLPMVRRVMERLTRSHALPPLPEGILKPRVVVGVAALGRTEELRKIMLWAESSMQTIGQQEFSRRVNSGELMYRLAAAADITTRGLIKTDEELQQEQHQNTLQDAAVRAAPQMAQAVMNQGAPDG